MFDVKIFSKDLLNLNITYGMALSIRNIYEEALNQISIVEAILLDPLRNSSLAKSRKPFASDAVR